VAALLKINEKTAYKLAAKGAIPGFKVGGSWRFDQSEIESWIRRESGKHGKGEDGTNQKEE
jgi:excisionase family DNA binding protein